MSVSKSVWGSVKQNCSELKQFLALTRSLLDFCSQKLRGLTFLALAPWTGGPGVGLALLTPEISLPNFHSSHMYVGPARSTSPPLNQSRMLWFL